MWGLCLVQSPTTPDPVNPAGVLETLPPGFLAVCSCLVEMLKFVSQHNYSLPGSQVGVQQSWHLHSLDTARFSPPTLSNYRNVWKTSKFLWLLEPTTFLFVGGGVVPGGQSGVPEWHSLLFLYGYREVLILLVCDVVLLVLQTFQYKVVVTNKFKYKLYSDAIVSSRF